MLQQTVSEKNEETNLIEEEEIEQDQYLVFNVRGQEFGVQAMHIQEITAMFDISGVPNAPPHIQGILNLRGKLVSVVNFRKRFGFEPKELDEDTRIIIMEYQGFPVGIIVDSVEEVIRIPANKVQTMPLSATASLPEGYIIGVGLLESRLVILLDVARVLDKSDLVKPEDMEKAIEGAKGLNTVRSA